MSGRNKTIAHAVAFVLGFSFVFVVAGASASALGEFVGHARTLLTQLLGILVIALGLNMVGLYRIPYLSLDKRLRMRTDRVSYLGSFLVGIGFAAGWSPCIGPILAGVLAMAADTHTVGDGAALLTVYAVGLAIPFLITAAALQYVLPVLTRIKRFLPVLEAAAGILIIAMGIVLLTDQWLWLTGLLYAHFPALASIGSGPEMKGEAVSVGAAFLAGLLSFVSPCVLPLVPVYLSFLTGQSVPQMAVRGEPS